MFYLFGMKKSTGLLFLIAILIACDDSKPVAQRFQKTLFEVKFIKENPQWQLLDDTLRNTVTIGYSGLEVPMDIEWQRAKDEFGCLKIASMRFIQTGGDTAVKVRDFTFKHHPCIKKSAYEETIFYESVDVDFVYFAKTRWGVYNLTTNLGVFFGSGKVILNRVYFLDQRGVE